MIDNIQDNDANVRSYKQLHYRWKLRLSILPRHCQLSGDKIPMFSYAYKGVRKSFHPAMQCNFYAWASKEQYLFEKIKGTVQ